MNPDDEHISKFIKLLLSRGFEKEAGFFEELFMPKPTPMEFVTSCPICGNEPSPECVLCDGTGELVSVVPDDDEDIRVIEELGKKQLP